MDDLPLNKNDISTVPPNKQLEIKEQDLRKLYENLNVGIWMKEYPSWEITYISKGAEEILQIPLDIFLNEKLWEKMIHPEDKDIVFEKRKLVEAGQTVSHQYRINCGEGTEKWIYDQTVPSFDEDGNITSLFGLFADITEEIKMQQQLDHFATHDPLTTLPNQRSLYEKLDELCSSEQINQFAVLHLDLDRFILINNSFGYDIGDLVLKKVVKKLKTMIPKDAFISRMGNNDFILVTNNYRSKQKVFQLAKKLMTEIEEPLEIHTHKIYITTSIGISFFPDDGHDKIELLRSAHAALYRAKGLDKSNYQLYSFSKDITSYKKYMLELDLREAIKNEEFELYYQPQIKPETGDIQGAEALIRWHHKEWGLVSPDEFIPLAEENHLIKEIDKLVIKKVCTQLRNWINSGYTIQPISINISPARFMEKGLVELVKDQLAIHQIRAEFLIIEITESSPLKSEESVVNTINQLRQLGIKIAIDDFGTGYSSLQYLRDFPADIIKIDQLFIQSIQTDSIQDSAIIASIFHLAKGLGLKIVAEGVEEYEQLEFLKQNNCDQIQGYLFSKPVPNNTFRTMLKTGYITPTKPQPFETPKYDERSLFRLQLPTHMIAEISIIEISNHPINLGRIQILVENISVNGLKILSSLNLPVNSTIKFKFFIHLIGEEFELGGQLIWKNETKRNTFHYGGEFFINKTVKKQLKVIIQKMIHLQEANREIPNTPFSYEDPYDFLQNDQR